MNIPEEDCGSWVSVRDLDIGQGNGEGHVIGHRSGRLRAGKLPPGPGYKVVLVSTSGALAPPGGISAPSRFNVYQVTDDIG